MKRILTVGLSIITIGAMIATAFAWDPKPADTQSRVTEVKNQLAGLERDAAMDKKAAFAKQSKPAWISKGSWRETDGGKSYAYAVGMSSKIKNQRLAISTAENRARAEMGKLMSGVKQTVKETPSGRTITTKSESTQNSVEIVDWYVDEAAQQTYALAVLIERSAFRPHVR